MKDITHVVRPSLPWRPEQATECGLNAERHPTWSRDEAIAKCREMGKQRFSMFVCMTCMHTADRHATWDQDPASCLQRFTEKYQIRWSGESPDSRRFNDELRAIALLVAQHRTEFEALVESLQATESLSAARSRARRMS